MMSFDSIKGKVKLFIIHLFNPHFLNRSYYKPIFFAMQSVQYRTPTVQYRTPTVHYRTLLFQAVDDYQLVAIVARGLLITYQTYKLFINNSQFL